MENKLFNAENDVLNAKPDKQAQPCPENSNGTPELAKVESSTALGANDPAPQPKTSPWPGGGRKPRARPQKKGLARLNSMPYEHQEAVALVSWMKERRGLLFCHVGNERACSTVHGSRLKAMGIRPGVPDYLIFTSPPKQPGARGCFIELKRRGGYGHSDLQDAWHKALRNCGWVGDYCHGAAAAVEFLRKLGY